MLKKDLIHRNPLRLMGKDNDAILASGGFGAILARAGVGKTSFLVQLALDSLLMDKNVLHISLGDTVDKVSLWYEEVFRHLSDQSANYTPADFHQLWEEILPKKFIMAFTPDSFSPEKLVQKLADLETENQFTPKMALFDGLDFDQPVRETLMALKEITASHGVDMWFSMRIHRHEAPDADGLPVQFSQVKDLFDVALMLQPEKDKIHIRPIKGGTEKPDEKAFLDPASMLVQYQ